MGDVEALKGLLARVRAAEGPDHDLDAEIMMGTGILTRTNLMAQFAEADPIWEYVDAERRTQGRHSPMVGRVSGSIDAALSLTQRLLPDARIEIAVNEICGDQCFHSAFVWPTGTDAGSAWACATPALALCSGLLTALIAQAEGAADA